MASGKDKFEDERERACYTRKKGRVQRIKTEEKTGEN
jgi:hypothetical protein